MPSHRAFFAILTPLVLSRALAQDLSTNSTACFTHCGAQAVQSNTVAATSCNATTETLQCICDNPPVLADAEACLAATCPKFNDGITAQCGVAAVPVTIDGAAGSVLRDALAALALAVGALATLSGSMLL